MRSEKEKIFMVIISAKRNATRISDAPQQTEDRHCEPTGRATARPMTGSAKQSKKPTRLLLLDCFVAAPLAMTRSTAQFYWLAFESNSTGRSVVASPSWSEVVATGQHVNLFGVALTYWGLSHEPWTTARAN